MTVEEPNTDDSFQGLMRSLNLEESQFKPYNLNFQAQNFNQLSGVKSEIESQLGLFFDLLKNKYDADMNTSLVSNDGYPRSDIDVVSIRLIRVKIIRLRNDHKSLLRALEQKLIEQLGRQNNDDESIEQDNELLLASNLTFIETYSIPFALVKEVVTDSPAHKSGLREGDKIVLFDGDIHVRNHENLASISRRVMGRIDQSLTVQVVRPPQQHEAEDKQLVLELTPTNNWDGRGVLGCRIVPL